MARFHQLLTQVLPVLLVLATLAVVAGISLHASPWPFYWQEERADDLATWVALMLVLATILRFTLQQRAAPVLIALVGLYLVLATGIVSLLAVLYFAGAAVLLGLALLLLLHGTEGDAPEPATAFFTGLAAGLAVLGLMLHLPVFYRSLLFGLLLGPWALLLFTDFRTQCRRTADRTLAAGAAWLRDTPWPMLVALVVVVGYVSRHAFYPTIMYDDVALHLRLWTELSWLHQADFDFRTHVWALAPIAVDLQHAVVSLLANADARASLNLLWLALLLGQLWQLVSYYTRSPWYAGLLLLVFASTPILASLLLTLQTELFLAVLTTTAVRLIVTQPLGWHSTTWPALLAIAALCCATKLPGAVLGLLLLAAAALKTYLDTATPTAASRVRVWWLLPYLLILAILAFHSYVNSWVKTGSPLFPLYNAIFKSPFFDSSTNMIDSRWDTGFSPMSWWDMFFATSRHYESFDLAAGYQYVLLVPLALLAALTGTQRRQWWPLVLPLCGFGVIMFASIQYWRYLFPVLPLATVLLATLLPLGRTDWRATGTSLAALLAASALNLLFFPGINWVFAWSPHKATSESKRELLVQEVAGPVAINARLNSMATGLRVLYPQSEGFGATLWGQPLYPVWFSPDVVARAARIASVDDAGSFLRDMQADFVIWSLHEPNLPGSQTWLLGLWLARNAVPEFQIGSHIAYRVVDRAPVYSPHYRLPQSVIATASTDSVVELPLGRQQAVRYNSNYQCADNGSSALAQINWDNGTAYYRLLPCTGAPVEFSEAIPVPAGVTAAQLHITAREGAEVDIDALQIETY